MQLHVAGAGYKPVPTKTLTANKKRKAIGLPFFADKTATTGGWLLLGFVVFLLVFLLVLLGSAF